MKGWVNFHKFYLLALEGIVDAPLDVDLDVGDVLADLVNVEDGLVLARLDLEEAGLEGLEGGDAEQALGPLQDHQLQLLSNHLNPVFKLLIVSSLGLQV